MSSSSDESRAIDLYCPLCGPVDIAVIVGARYSMRTEVWRTACNIVVASDTFEAQVHTCGTFDPDEPPPWATEPPDRVTASCALCSAAIEEADRFVAAPIRTDYIRGSTAAICDQCISASHQVILDYDGDDPFVLLPLRIVGPVPDPDASAAIVSAFQDVFGNDDLDVITPKLEDGQRFREPIRETLAGLPDFWLTSGVRVDRIHFLNAERAEVDFADITDDGGIIANYVGHAIHRGGRWLVTAETFTQVYNISLSPPE